MDQLFFETLIYDKPDSASVNGIVTVMIQGTIDSTVEFIDFDASKLWIKNYCSPFSFRYEKIISIERFTCGGFWNKRKTGME